MTLPNFLIIGAAKSATTALYDYLNQHPQVYMSPVKEPHFFAYEGETLNFQGPNTPMNSNPITHLADYQALFDDVHDEIAVGEASPTYLPSEKACRRINQLLPDVKLIIILRQPADRAYSHYLHMVREDREPLLDFEAALAAEDERMAANWGFGWDYAALGYYYSQVKRYFDTFDRRQIRVYLYDDFRADARSVLCDIYGFLGVDTQFVADMNHRPNPSGVHKNPLLRSVYHAVQYSQTLRQAVRPLLPKALRHQIYKRITTTIRQRNLVKPTLDEAVYRRLTAQYRDDIAQLSMLIDRDLSGWVS